MSQLILEFSKGHKDFVLVAPKVVHVLAKIRVGKPSCLEAERTLGWIALPYALEGKEEGVVVRGEAGKMLDSRFRPFDSTRDI